MLKTIILMAAIAAAPTVVELPLERLKADKVAASAFDYHGLRTGRDAAALEALVARVPEPETRCLTDSEVEIRAGLLSAATTASPDTWRNDREIARNAVTRYAGVREALLGGGKSGSTNLDNNIASFTAAAKTAKSPEAAEVLTRTARDQIALHYPTGQDAISAGAETRIGVIAGQEACNVTRANTAWLKKTIAARGWFTLSRDGEQADKSAWLIVQHSDFDPAFQQQVLTMLTGLKAKGETSPRNYAYLYDRVANSAGRPQRYATQGRCVGPGDWQPFALEDAANIEAIRKEAGLPTLVEYRSWFGCR